MPTSSQKLRLGIFIFVGIFAFLILMIIIGSEQIFKEKDIYFISYKDISVSGLEVGSPVKYLGVGVGSIKDIHIDPEDVSRVVVSVALEPGTPIKRDARAEIAIIGITGLKMIEIRGRESGGCNFRCRRIYQTRRINYRSDHGQSRGYR